MLFRWVWQEESKRTKVCVCKWYRTRLGIGRIAAKHPLYIVRFGNHLQFSLWLFVGLVGRIPYLCRKFLLVKVHPLLSCHYTPTLCCYQRITAFNRKGRSSLRLQGHRGCREKMCCAPHKIVVWRKKCLVCINKNQQTQRIYLVALAVLHISSFTTNHNLNVNISRRLPTIRKFQALH